MVQNRYSKLRLRARCRKTWDLFLRRGTQSSQESGPGPQLALSSESFRGASSGLGGLFLTILRRRSGFERSKKTGRDSRNFLDSSLKRGFVRLGRLVETTNLSHKLE